jgi:peptidoglycan/LPS O-acetylase OafA/YrhL
MDAADVRFAGRIGRDHRGGRPSRMGIEGKDLIEGQLDSRDRRRRLLLLSGLMLIGSAVAAIGIVVGYIDAVNWFYAASIFVLGAAIGLLAIWQIMLESRALMEDKVQARRLFR